jgi:tRNA pseudouridine55 synthase
MAGPLTGLLLIDKPANWTSHDVVAKLRGVLGTREVGHAGTLDPQATGLLVLAIGGATRWLNYLPGDKTYKATVRFGVETDTEDIWGQMLQQRDTSKLDEKSIRETLQSLTKLKEQTPPMVSALKKDGRRLYDLAREGQVVEREARPVQIDAVRVTAVRPGEADFEVDCGAGTYVRTLCAEAGKQLGVGACMAALQRIRSGRFQLSDAAPEAQWTLEQLQPRLLDASQALANLRGLDLDDAQAADILQGRSVKVAQGGEGTWRLNHGGRLLALAEMTGQGADWKAAPKRVFNA